MNSHNLAFVVLGSLAVATGAARADFIGQTIHGPLSAGSSITDSLIGESDDNDGFTSGDHPFNIWDGGDIVYGLDWAGGGMSVTLTPLDFSDPDLFIYRPSDLNDSGDYSITNGIDNVTINNAPAGFYYIVVDTTFFNEGDFRLDVAAVPAPAPWRCSAWRWRPVGAAGDLAHIDIFPVLKH